MDETLPNPQDPGPAEAATSAPALASTVPAPSAGAAIPQEGTQSEPGVLCFGLSPRALGQRRFLTGLLAALIVAVLYLDLETASAWPAWARSGPWILAAGLAWFLWRVARVAVASPLAGREVLLRPQALELRRGGFRRLVVFESIRHLHIVQSPGGRLWRLRLDLEDDSVTLRDVDGLPRIFAAAAERRPAGTLIEVEEVRIDWEEPLPWILLAAGLALVAALGLAFA